MKTCSVHMCGRRFIAKGYCNKHYKRVMRNGTIHSMRPKVHTIDTLKKRLKTNVSKNGSCIEWQGSLDRDGYGAIKYKGRKIAAHRLVAHAFLDFDIDSDLFVLHKCDNPKCINKNHLFFGTHIDNMRDMAKKGRARNQYYYLKAK